MMLRRTFLAGATVAAIPVLAMAEEQDILSMTEEASVCEAHVITSLPFVRDATRAERRAGMPPRIFWDVKPSGDYTKDCGTGARYAQLALEYMASQNFIPLLGWVVLDMMRNGPEYSGIEVGFLSVFGRNATAAAKISTAARHIA